MQFQTDPRYGDFVERASVREVLGIQLPVAAVEDVLQGKIWGGFALEPALYKTKDLLDIQRLLESFPALEMRVPDDILQPLR